MTRRHRFGVYYRESDDWQISRYGAWFDEEPEEEYWKPMSFMGSI